MYPISNLYKSEPNIILRHYVLLGKVIKYSHPCIETFFTSKSKIHNIIVKPIQCSLCSKFKMYYSCLQFFIPINFITWNDFLQLLFFHTSVSFQSIYSWFIHFRVFRDDYTYTTKTYYFWKYKPDASIVLLKNIWKIFGRPFKLLSSWSQSCWVNENKFSSKYCYRVSREIIYYWYFKLYFMG